MSDPTLSPAATVPWPIERTARRIGHYRWWEMRLFELVGAWARSVPEPQVAARLGDHSHRHGWHAELWGDLIPELDHLSADRVVAAPDGLDGLVEVLEGGSDADTCDRLVGVYRVVVPRLVAAYGHHLDHTLAATDGPTIRVLRLALSDLAEDLQHAERLVQGLITTPDDVERVASRAREIETIIVSAGGICGSDTLG